MNSNNFSTNVTFKFLSDGKLKFENNSESEFDIMVHYTTDKQIKKTLYLHPGGRKFTKEKPKRIFFENEFMFENKFTRNSFNVPIFCLTVYPKENREYVTKSKIEQKEWNESVIRNLNIEFRESYKMSEYQIYEDYYYNLNQNEEKNKIIPILKQETNAWKTKLIKEDEGKEDEEDESKNSYKGLNKVKRMQKLLSEITKLQDLKQKLGYSKIKFEFSFESEIFNFDSKIDD